MIQIISPENLDSIFGKLIKEIEPIKVSGNTLDTMGEHVPAVLWMSVKWLGASENIVQVGKNYILLILICTFFTCAYLGITGFLEGEGRPILYSAITISTSIANVIFFFSTFFA